MEIKPDIEVMFEFVDSNKEHVFEGYRPAHSVKEDYFTTGIHHYDNLADTDNLNGTISFLSPDKYPGCLWVGKKIKFQEGKRLIGYATVLKIHNPILELKVSDIDRIINLWDPIGLFPMAPEDEYECESKKIYDFICSQENIKAKNLGLFIEKVFSDAFGSDIFVKDLFSCVLLANSIIMTQRSQLWNLLNGYLDGTYPTKVFCNAFCRVFFAEKDGSLTEYENYSFGELSKFASPACSSMNRYQTAFCFQEELLREKAADIKKAQTNNS